MQIYDNGLLKLISKTILRDVTIKILIHINENQTSNKNDLRDKLGEFAQAYR
jgi:predicted DNA-binding antitoxin AbrB/MazE fold protein